MIQTVSGKGVIVPMITPFTSQGKIDHGAVKRIVNHLISGGSVPFILGTTGESASIPEEERPDFVCTMVEQSAGRAKTYAGISSPSFQTSVVAAKRYFDLGVDVVVAHPPAYYPLSAEQLLRYYEQLADSIPGPLIIYNIPPVTHVSIPLDVTDKLSEHDKIIAIKDSERDLDRFNKSLQLWRDRNDFDFLIGWGAQMAHGLVNGAGGIVPSTGNIDPKSYSDLFDAARAGDTSRLENLQKYLDAVSAIYQEGRKLGDSLAALKIIMKTKNLCEHYVLPPLTQLSQEDESSIVKRISSLEGIEENNPV